MYDRDFLWNFRDVSKNNPRIKSGLIFRTATMSLFQNESNFEAFLDGKNIKTVIDLRADREIEELPYTEKSLSKFNYVKAQLDPWNQPDWFEQNHQYGTNEEIAYRFFGMACNHKIKDVIEAILNEKEGASAIHCHAGKDRTGIIISLLHLLVDTPMDVVYADYLASENDIHPRKLKIVLDIIEEKGGVKPYLINCGLTENQIEELRNKIINE
jgi:protein tyrosine/serine phosphatase